MSNESPEILFRKYRTSDCGETAALFRNTVHTINVKDYTREQLDAWAPETMDLEQWDRTFQTHYSIVAVTDERIVGFGDIDQTGYLDRLFVHRDWQGQNIGSAICERLEEYVQGKIVTHASITARGFFEKRGYTMVKEQQVERQGVLLTNFVMEKRPQFQFLPTATNNIFGEPPEREQEPPEPKGDLPCPCCGCVTIPEGGQYTAHICPVCFWEMDSFIRSDDEPSDQNHGLTLKQCRENYKTYGASQARLRQYCRPPRPDEKPQET